jgi:membrane associated rhomboid family serine protease
MTYAIIAVTVVVSILAFNRQDLFDRLKFNAYLILNRKEWYRFLSYGLVHADYIHLLINMFVLYSFGEIVEIFFEHYFGLRSHVFYLLLYIGGLAFSTLYDFGMHKRNSWYNAVGASGAVSAVVFSSIILYPTGKIFLFFVPIGIPAPLFGLLYLGYSFYMAKKAKDNIGHNAHFFGALFGILFTVLLNKDILKAFIQEVFGGLGLA